MNSKPWADFPSNNRKQWETQARKELNGEDPFEKLKLTKGTIEVLPYYEQNESINGEAFRLPVSSNPYLGARTWLNTPKVKVTNVVTANEKALFHLNNGADGVCFDLFTKDVFIADLLKEIQLPYCAVFFSGMLTTTFLNDLMNFLGNQVATSVFSGAVFQNEKNFQAHSFKNKPELDSFFQLGVDVENKATREETLAHALFTAVSWVEQLKEIGYAPSVTIHQIAFQVSIGTDFFHEIAMLRSLRCLWRLVAHAYGIPSRSPHIHVINRSWISEQLQPHSNLLKNTTGGLAAVLGGCDSLSVEPEDETHPLMERMARNVSLLFREEAHLSKVADPLAGSYYVDSLTSAMATKAWFLFNQLS